MSGFKPKETLYTLPHGIEVIGEYPRRGVNRYWRVRVRPHQFFKGRIVSGGIYIRRSRAVITSVVGRALLPSEHIHHKNEDQDDDTPSNLEIVNAGLHNSHHKTGSTHRAETKARISESLKLAYDEGRHAVATIQSRDHMGRIAK